MAAATCPSGPSGGGSGRCWSRVEEAPPFDARGSASAAARHNSAWRSSASACAGRRPRRRRCAAPTGSSRPCSIPSRTTCAHRSPRSSPSAAICGQHGGGLERSEERTEFAEAIDGRRTGSTGIVGNLLDLSRIEGGSLRPDKDSERPRRCWSTTSSRDRARGARAHDRVGCPRRSPAAVPIDYVEMDQVIANLLENAVKYSPIPAPKIRMRRAHAMTRACRCRWPTVAAASRAERGRLFAPFYRARRAAAAPQGSGLGLAMAAASSRRTAATIAAGTADVAGAVLSFTLPRTAGSRANRRRCAPGARRAGRARGRGTHPGRGRRAADPAGRAQINWPARLPRDDSGQR